MSTKKKKKKRKHATCLVTCKIAKDPSAEHSSTSCPALILLPCSPSPTKGRRQCPPLKSTLFLFRKTVFLKGIWTFHQIVEQKSQCRLTPSVSCIVNINHGLTLPSGGSAFCLSCPALWIRKNPSLLDCLQS